MKACCKLAMLPTMFTAWMASQGMGGVDWHIAWPWIIGMLAGTWTFFWGVLYALFPNLKFGGKSHLISKMNEDLVESDQRLAGDR